MTTPVIQPVILCGGSGTRLWPLSREHYPKQLIPLLGQHTLLQETILRLDVGPSGEGSAPLQVAAPIIVCNEEHRFLVAEQLEEINKETTAIILEPQGRNTAPALTLAALALENAGDNHVMLVMPADHYIQDRQRFQHTVQEGAALAGKDQIVTFGVIPTAPETGYGYIRKGPSLTGDSRSEACAIAAFTEKPGQQEAQDYLASGQYLWNSGMFMMRPDTWLRAIEACRGDIAATCRKAHAAGTVDDPFYRVDQDTFSSCPSDSIDYAVMERLVGADNPSGVSGIVVPLDAGWSDVGAWSTLWQIGNQDEHGNVASGDVYTHDTRNTMLVGNHRLVVGVGLEDMVVIETADAVFVARKDRAQDVKEVVQRLKADSRSEYQMHRRVYRPWGSYDGVDTGERFQVKRIVVKPGAALSLQMHRHRAEHWIVVRGTARVTRNDDVFLLYENESTYIPVGTRHRLENPGDEPLEIIEVQSGDYLGEDDIVRYDDAYGRKISDQ